MVKFRNLLLSALLLRAVASSAAGVDTMPGIFSPMFKSLRTTVQGVQLAPPVISLSNPMERVQVEFDELAEDMRYLRYRLVHCDMNWRPSALLETEYLDGFNEAEVYSYALSEATLAHYVHYELTVPNEDMRPTLSGNYLLQVYDENDPDEVLLQTRFMLTEGTAGLSASLTSRTDVDYNREHQQLAVTADLERAAVADAFNDLRLVLEQNGRPDSRRVIDKPLRIGPKMAVWEHQPQLIFPAGKEYRRIEMVTVHFPARGIDRYEYADPYYHAILSLDEPRAGMTYVYDEDQSGRYFIGELNVDDPAIQADYVVTHFTLKMPELKGTDVYLDGDFVQRRFDADSRMVYNSSMGAYTKTLLLKQGLYNYQYLTPRDGTASIEGNDYQTVNEYLILLYYRPPMARADRLIGTTMLQ